jgi:molybdopterin-binding protein
VRTDKKILNILFILFILFSSEAAMKISARNVLKGKVIKIVPGAVNSEVVIQIAGGAEVVSVITKESAESLDLQVGKEVYAVIKASNVMVAID